MHQDISGFDIYIMGTVALLNVHHNAVKFCVVLLSTPLCALVIRYHFGGFKDQCKLYFGCGPEVVISLCPAKMRTPIERHHCKLEDGHSEPHTCNCSFAW